MSVYIGVLYPVRGSGQNALFLRVCSHVYDHAGTFHICEHVSMCVCVCVRVRVRVRVFILWLIYTLHSICMRVYPLANLHLHSIILSSQVAVMLRCVVQAN